MASHENHHFVPVFLLKQWHTPPDDKLSCFSWLRGRLHHKRYKAKSVGKEEGLYTLIGVADSERNAIERDFMGPEIDEPAANAHQTLLATGVNGLNGDQKAAWSRFIVSLMVRTPDQVQAIREKGRHKLRETLEADPQEYETVRNANPAGTLWEWLQLSNPHVIENFGISVFTEMMDSELLNGAVMNGWWATMPLGTSRFDLLIGDRPLIYVGKMSERFVVALPIAPRRLFVAVDSKETWRRADAESANVITKKANRDTVTRAVEYAYATNTLQERFVERYLRKPT